MMPRINITFSILYDITKQQIAMEKLEKIQRKFVL